MSMNATVRSSSSTRVEGISPATILQKRQSGSAMAGGYPSDLYARLPQRPISGLVLRLRSRPCVARAVDLDHEVVVRPVEVDLDLGVHERLWALPGLEEAVLEC